MMIRKNSPIFLIIANLIFTVNIYGQGITSRINLTPKDGTTERFDRIIIDIKTDQWLETPPGIKTKPYSIGVSAYLYKDLPLTKRSNLALAFGVGLSSDNIHHNGTFSTSTNEGKSFTKLVPLANNFETKINKLTLTYIEVPFELRLRTMNKKMGERRKFNFRFYPGFKVGYMMGNHTKLVTDDTKIKVYRTPNTLPYKYGPTLRIGFNKISFVGFYSLTGIFKEGQGNDLKTFSVGLSLLMF